MNKVAGKNVAIASGIICILLAISLVGAIANYTSIISAKDNTITSQDSTIKNLNTKIKAQLQTIVFHVSEKGESHTWGHLPNATDTYNQIQALNNDTYQILLLPEYEGHQNWTQELSWIANNFGGKNGIPIMLDAFGGGEDHTPTPMLTTTQISQAMAVANVQWLRFYEILSWHLEYNQTFPTDHVTNILAFCKTNNLKIFWTEWKTDYLPNAENLTAIQNYTKDYENITTVSFSTNSQDLQPTDGFLYLNGNFKHWGASIQAWYWTTYDNSDLQNMPASLLLEHALSAKSLGAEIIEFEPYWYFFDNGQANDNLKLLVTMLT